MMQIEVKKNAAKRIEALNMPADNLQVLFTIND
jgi:hypothetical protein